MNENEIRSFYRHKAVLITGGLGFIGSNLARRLADLDAQVLVVDSLIPDYGGNLFNVHGIEDRIRVNIADVRDQNSMNYLVRGQDIFFNLAGQVSHIDSMLDPHTDLEINCRSQLSMLEACRKHNPGVKVVYAGTRQVYGKPRYLPVDEDHLLQPTDVNGINTMAGEWYHILYNNVYGVRACSLRLTNTYGPRLLVKHNRQGFIGWFIRQVLDGQEIQLFGDGQQKRDMIFVDDVVEAFLLAGMIDEANGQIFNVGGPQQVSLLEFVQLLVETARCGSYKLVPFPAERKSIDIGDYYADCTKIRNTLGWEATIPLREGLERTVRFYQDNREHYW